jgi:hypothetical protein
MEGDCLSRCNAPLHVLLFVSSDAYVDGVNDLRRALPGGCRSPINVVALLTEQRTASPFASLERNLVMILVSPDCNACIYVGRLMTPFRLRLLLNFELGVLLKMSFTWLHLCLSSPLPRSARSPLQCTTSFIGSCNSQCEVASSSYLLLHLPPAASLTRLGLVTRLNRPR